MAHFNCLIVDDEEELAKMTKEYFTMFDVSTEYVCSAGACYDFLETNTVDLLLLDINLGDGSGFEVCKRVRAKWQLPILFISARQSDDDVLAALSIGGDDYVKKPYSLSVLLAKVRVNLKRVEQMKKLEEDAARKESDEVILRLDESTMSAVRNGQRIPLKAKEFALLACLFEHKDTIVKKEVLFDEVWGDAFYSDGTLNVHIRKLREKLEKDPNHPELIRTVWGTGYMLKTQNKE
ncbi:MAG: response regulator transcription factor [Eubacterium sp.]|nr:response regulator transcription factor [Eubacterium sp.]